MMASRPKLVIYGNGQMARLFLHFARSEFDVVAFTVDRPVIAETVIEGLPVIPFDTIDQHYPPADHVMIIVVGFLEMNRLRTRKHQEAKALGYRLTSYIHPSVVRHPNLIVGEGSVVLDHVALHPYTRLGDGVFICSNASLGHGCTVENFCWINSGVAVGGETCIGEGSFLGINATLGDNVTLAHHCYVGANTLITRSTQPEEVFIAPAGERFPLDSAAFLQFIARSA